MVESPIENSAEEDALWDMSDEELEQAVKDSRSEVEQPNEDSIEESDVESDVAPEDEEVPDSEEETVSEEEAEVETSEEVKEDQSDDEVDGEAETETNNEPTDSAPEKFKVKANGNDFEFTQEELIALAPKAMDYTKKLQEIAPWRKALSAMEENGLSEEDINTLIDIKSGNKEALASLMDRLGVDPMEVEVDEGKAYEPQSYGKSEEQLAVQDVVNRISADPEFQRTQYVVDTQWDSGSRETLAENPQLIESIHNEIKSGVYDVIANEALKLKALSNGQYNDLQYYATAAEHYYNEQATPAEEDPAIKAEEARRKQQATIKQQASKRKAAGVPASKSGKKVVDYLDDSDEAYDEWYKKTMANV